MAAYPIVVDLVGRACLVVGGGAVAERKVDGLLAADASVTVVSPTLTSALAAFVRDSRIRHARRRYRRGDLAGVTLAFVATGDRHVAAAVAREGRRCGVWVNAADDPAHCDFFLPSVLRRGPLLVAVATGGAILVIVVSPWPLEISTMVMGLFPVTSAETVMLPPTR